MEKNVQNPAPPGFLLMLVLKLKTGFTVFQMNHRENNVNDNDTHTATYILVLQRDWVLYIFQNQAQTTLDLKKVFTEVKNCTTMWIAQNKSTWIQISDLRLNIMCEVYIY